MRKKLLSDIVDEESANGRPIVGSSDGTEVLLSSRIPYLELDAFISDLNGARSKLNSDGNLMSVVNLLLDELQNYT
jgi:hypothetical protein